MARLRYGRRRYSSYYGRYRSPYRRQRFLRRARYYSGRVPLATRGFKGYEGRKVQEEKNYKDYNLALTPTLTVPTIDLISGVAQGTSVSERVGRRICIKSVQIRALMRSVYSSDQVTAASFLADSWRIMLVWDTQVNGVAPTINDILTVSAAGYASSLTNLNNRERFKVLMDKVGDYSFCGGVSDGPASQEDQTAAQHQFKKYIKMNHIVTFNSGTTDVVGSITTGALWLVCISGDANNTNGIIHYIKPKPTSVIVATDVSTGTLAASNSGVTFGIQWIDCAQSNIVHNGIKIVYDPQGLVNNVNLGRISFIFDVEYVFKGYR